MRFPPSLTSSLCSVAFTLAANALPAATPISFEREIQPILSENCYHCHGPDAEARKAKLRLDQRDSALAVGKSGYAAIVPGKPADSELVARIFSDDPEDVMPSPKSNRTLTAAQKDLLKRWIAEGATWSEHWAFIPPQRPAVPRIENPKSKIQNPVDAFVRARLASEKPALAPAPEAAPAALIRRVTLDLHGLPPTPDEVEAFERASRENPNSAYENLVDRLLASPRYGERWAWDWLDLARYADTNGFQGDPERTMWPWRDWVVNAFNANMPFDQFTLEQLAGDLLPDATREQKIASGFHRNNMFNGEGGRIAEETRVENVFDRVETTATVWLGLTFTCNRCHDHKFDPLKQTDYYALYDIFNQMSETGSASGGGGRGGQMAPFLDLSTDAERATVKAAQARFDAAAKDTEAYELKKFPRPEGKPLTESPEALALPGNLPNYIAKTEPKRRGVDALLEAVPYFRDTAPDPEYAHLLQASLDAARARDTASSNITKVMIMDQLATPRDTFVLNKGNYEAKTDVRVLGQIPAVFAVAASASEPTTAPTRLNRLDLARWLVSPANPLAARTAVNRAWQAFFGTGFVKTAEDFGVQGERPSHPELLDWLATEYVASGWNTKALHRLIVTSATYRQSSRVTPAAHERDPENRLLARGPRYRLPSWMLRDQALAAAGLLVDQRGGPSVKPYQPPGIWEEATFGKKTYQQDHGDALYRRSLYVFWRRIVGPTTFFDAGARQVCTVKIARTNTPLHALVTLNDPAYVEAARVMAQRVLAFAPKDSARIAHAFRLATARAPTTAEQKILAARLAKLRLEFAADLPSAHALSATGEFARPESLAPAEHAAWTTLCLLILNLDETLSKE